MVAARIWSIVRTGPPRHSPLVYSTAEIPRARAGPRLPGRIAVFRFQKNNVCKAPTLSYNGLQRGEGLQGVSTLCTSSQPSLEKLLGLLPCAHRARVLMWLIT